LVAYRLIQVAPACVLVDMNVHVHFLSPVAIWPDDG